MYFRIKKRISEVNIQAEFYHRCKMLGINVYLGYRHENCIFDAVIFNESNEIVVIVEFKSYIDELKENYDTKQIRKYKRYNIPVYICGHMNRIDETIDKVMFHL